MRALQFLLLGVLIALVPGQALATSMGEAIDRAGQQRMLSQRIAQSYLLSMIQPDKHKGPDTMARAIRQFETNAAVLQRFAGARPISGDLKKVLALWAGYKTLAEAPVSPGNAELLLVQSDALLASAHAYVQALEKLSGSNKGEVVNISGRQRMLSQRIAKNYFAYYLKLGGEERIKALYEDLAEYETVLGLLEENPLNTEDIVLKLRRVSGHFAYASKGFDGLMSLTGDRLIFVITGTTDAMLKNMDDVTKMYAAL
ncbi:type IV pili methyl-accepting chemotaxis transducer N-terminal domain-containing protein [Simiduia sp. 21SJ11W-1]|uniref:type IV pili methyl-accepting chemotaxis transducer N-terminal domain-containing protein n=1 Tax=Simiduia sp. 21SJ11W-1 TaxID=2909669 RepID=UPI00209D8DEA|nr:type IV pili methyl-accepting chemotaxis transducer N-terminal domain-containing protein [Simiduia sp. 21SJ11W-1]UTA47600.1 type IV pili methyl-accepting chemotaxis transducer N-terminal domain-containing protein [Simiduia sp. 21SJ11W-1]